MKSINDCQDKLWTFQLNQLISQQYQSMVYVLVYKYTRTSTIMCALVCDDLSIMQSLAYGPDAMIIYNHW